MKLEILDSENKLTYGFGRWIIRQIQFNFHKTVNPDKLKNWDNFFENSDEYSFLYSKPVKALTILQTGVRGLQCHKLPDKLIISFNSNQFMPGFDRVKVDTLCRLITFGNNSLQGYPIIKDVLQEVADNINDYIEQYFGVF